jgi:hypothetical protein
MHANGESIATGEAQRTSKCNITQMQLSHEQHTQNFVQLLPAKQPQHKQLDAAVNTTCPAAFQHKASRNNIAQTFMRATQKALATQYSTFPQQPCMEHMRKNPDPTSCTPTACPKEVAPRHAIG